MQRRRRRLLLGAGLSALAAGLMFALRGGDESPARAPPKPSAEVAREAPAPEAPIDGSVADETGKALAGVTLEAALVSDPVGAPPRAGTRSDATGSFRLRGLPAGRYAITARAELHELAVLPELITPAPAALRIVLTRTSALRGSVRGLDGKPAGGAQVIAAGSGLWPPRTLRADGDGRFELTPLPAGVYELRASAGDALSAPSEGLLLEPGVALTAELVLEPGAALAGKLIDAENDAPIAAAEIEVVEDALTATPARASSDAEGQFSVRPLRRVRQRVWVRAPGYVPLEGVLLEPGKAQRLALHRAGSLEGVVLDEREEPLAGVELEVVGQNARGAPLRVVGPTLRLGASVPPPASDNLGVTSGPVPKVPLLPTAAGLTDAASAPVGLGFRSGEGGRFRIDGIPAGRVEVVARHPGYATSRSARVALRGGQTVADLRIVLERGVLLVGRVVDAREFPVPSVRVELVLRGEPFARVTLSAQDGTFAFDAVRGRGTLSAHPTQAPHVEQSIELLGAGRHEVTLRLGAESRSLTGRVVDARGFPIESATVRVRALDPRSPAEQSAVAGADGTFVVAGLPAPPYRLEAQHPSFAPTLLASVSPDGAKPVLVELRPGAQLRGRVRDRLTGDPIAGAAVRVAGRTRKGQQLAGALEVATDAQGTFELRNLTPDTYSVSVRHSPHVPALAEAVLLAGDERELAAFELEPGGELGGDVVDRFGAPVRDAEVTVGDPPDWRAAARTDAAGRFRLTGIAPGRQLVWARHEQAGASGSPVRAQVYPRQESPGIVLRLPEPVR